MRKSDLLNSILLMSVLAEKNKEMFEGDILEPVIYIPNSTPPPNGTKEYFFNDLGEFSTEHMRKDECIFKCFALNDKNAKRKYDKFIKK